MKTVFVCLFAFILALSGFAQSVSSAAGGSVEISFRYVRQQGFSSNQFAVWVEDSEGGFVRTLYATDFTASGGYRIRKNSLPLWVERSGIKRMDAVAVDAVSGATPESGEQVFVWDCTDGGGKPAAAGTYTVYVEATLRRENRVLYSGKVTVGGSENAAAVSTEYFGTGTAEREMISGVKAVYRP